MKALLLSSLLLAPLALAMTAPEADAPAAQKATEPVCMQVAVGKSVSVVLAGNPTTGFLWQAASEKGGAAKVSTEIMAAQLKKGEPPVCGAPSPTKVIFTGVQPGKSTVVMEYKRPWEDEPAANSMTFIITVTAE